MRGRYLCQIPGNGGSLSHGICNALWKSRSSCGSAKVINDEVRRNPHCCATCVSYGIAAEISGIVKASHFEVTGGIIASVAEQPDRGVSRLLPNEILASLGAERRIKAAATR